MATCVCSRVHAAVAASWGSTGSPRFTARFKPGQLDQGDLNRAVLQLLYVSQEAADRVAALPTHLPREVPRGHREAH
jgi:hypothetical protein